MLRDRIILIARMYEAERELEREIAVRAKELLQLTDKKDAISLCRKALEKEIVK